MRLAFAVAILLAVTATAFAQEEEWVWPVPEIGHDVSALPAPVRAKFDALVAAARTGDIEALRPIIAAQDYPPNVSFGAPDDAVDFLREVSEDKKGRQILGLLLDLLDQPYAFHPNSDGETYYVWPYLAELDPNALTPEQMVDAYRLIDSEELADIRNFGGWHYWRVFISESGEWSAFVAGD